MTPSSRETRLSDEDLRWHIDHNASLEQRGLRPLLLQVLQDALASHADLRAALERAESAMDAARILNAELAQVKAYAAAAREVLEKAEPFLRGQGGRDGGMVAWRAVTGFLSSPTPPAVSLLQERLKVLEQVAEAGAILRRYPNLEDFVGTLIYDPFAKALDAINHPERRERPE